MQIAQGHRERLVVEMPRLGLAEVASELRTQQKNSSQ